MTPYGAELVEAVARDIAIRRRCVSRFHASADHCRGFRDCSRVGRCNVTTTDDDRRDSRTALLAACAKLKDPPREFLGIHDQMDVRVADGYRKYWRDRLSQLLTEIGSPT